jgi:hypothetical protein
MQVDDKKDTGEQNAVEMYVMFLHKLLPLNGDLCILHYSSNNRPRGIPFSFILCNWPLILLWERPWGARPLCNAAGGPWLL